MPALNTAPTRDLDLPIALWFFPSPPDSVVGTGSREANPGCWHPMIPTRLAGKHKLG